MEPLTSKNPETSAPGMTISRLAKKHGLSRSTLLYYDRIGLLRPAGRVEGGYRRYAPADDERLRAICLYRRTGLSLNQIRSLLDRPGRKSLAGVLERQLVEIAGQIEELRKRQVLIVELLKNPRLLEKVSVMNRETWVQLLRASGFTDVDLMRWHRDFERLDPERHRRFLEFLNIPPREIAAIRRHARGAPE